MTTDRPIIQTHDNWNPSGNQWEELMADVRRIRKWPTLPSDTTWGLWHWNCIPRDRRSWRWRVRQEHIEQAARLVDSEKVTT